ncbi:MAG: glycosyltransferase family 2 protein [Desulfobacterales bacterium]|nr:glycosyltransferase family 2 protein [Desulfobacterales bacterium]
MPPTRRPKLSVIVVVYDMQREATRTLYSLSPSYQKGVEEDEYEIVVVDNGSDYPLSESAVKAFGPNFTYHYIEHASPSPAMAMNYGIGEARGEHLGFMIDGARIVTPGIVRWALKGLEMFPRPIVATCGWHLGPEIQLHSIQKGYYNQGVEDHLLKRVSWEQDGYSLFTISTLAGASMDGFFMPMAESNALFMTREMVESLGRFDPLFNMPGGGLVNLDFYVRANDLPGSELLVILGEGSFHQIHGGVATNAQVDTNYFVRAHQQYKAIRGKDFKKPMREPVFIGHMPRPFLKFMEFSLGKVLIRAEKNEPTTF